MAMDWDFGCNAKEIWLLTYKPRQVEINESHLDAFPQYTKEDWRTLIRRKICFPPVILISLRATW